MYTNSSWPTRNIPIIISAGLSQPMGVKAGDITRTTFQGATYMSTVRGLVTKFPGFTFSGLNTIQLRGNTALMSMDQYKLFMEDVYNAYPDA